MQNCGRRLVEEMEAHRVNDTWQIVKLPPGKHAIGSGWFLKVKHNADGSLDPYKARFVAQGYTSISEMVLGSSCLYLLMIDITLACKDLSKIDSVVQELYQHFKLQDLGPTTQLLGIQIHRDCPNCLLSISQSEFISNLLQENGLSNSKPVVGSLIYLAVTTRPDIAYSARVLARFNPNPGLAHWQAGKHVPCLSQGHIDHKLVCTSHHSPLNPSSLIQMQIMVATLTMASPLVAMSHGQDWLWSSQSLGEHHVAAHVALSTTEAEHISVVEAAKEILWMCQFMGELGYVVSGPSLLRMDQSTFAVSKNPEHHTAG